MSLGSSGQPAVPPSVPPSAMGLSRLGLFGTYRFILANLVMLSHLWLSPLGNPGGPAVFAFFVLSGFLMTRSLRLQYFRKKRGVLHYLANRALRLYPTYWAVLLLGLAALLLVPDLAGAINGSKAMPASAVAWASNLLILGIGSFDGIPFPGYDQQFVSQIFSVQIELIYYFAMILLVRRAGIVLGWAAASLLYAVWVFTGLHGFAPQMKWGYMAYPAGTLAFSLGALVALAIDRWGPALRRLPVAAKAAAGLAFLLAFGYPGPHLITSVAHDHYVLGTYLSLLVSVPLTALLAAVDRDAVPAAWRRFDDLLGNLSYPLFLCHYIVAVFVVWAAPLPLWRGRFDAPFFFAVLPWIYAASALLYFGVEKPLERLRDRIRGGALRGRGAEAAGEDEGTGLGVARPVPAGD